MKKPLVLGILFILPLVIYLFFASGVNRFGRLPVLTPSMNWEIPTHTGDTLSSEELLADHISMVIFLGADLPLAEGALFNFNQKIYKRFYEFSDFQTLLFIDPSIADEVEEVLGELGQITDTSRYKSIALEAAPMAEVFQALETDLKLTDQGSSPYVFIVDKQASLRGRNDDEEVQMLYGYDMRSVAELNNKMEDDVKVILAEYRLALKKNYADR